MTSELIVDRGSLEHTPTGRVDSHVKSADIAERLQITRELLGRNTAEQIAALEAQRAQAQAAIILVGIGSDRENRRRVFSSANINQFARA